LGTSSWQDKKKYPAIKAEHCGNYIAFGLFSPHQHLRGLGFKCD
jgi:hypothetical protein